MATELQERPPSWLVWVLTWIDPRCWWMRGRLSLLRMRCWRIQRENRRLSAENDTLALRAKRLEEELVRRRRHEQRHQTAVAIAREASENQRRAQLGLRLSNAVAEKRQKLGRPLTLPELEQLIATLRSGGEAS